MFGMVVGMPRGDKNGWRSNNVVEMTCEKLTGLNRVGCGNFGFSLKLATESTSTAGIRLGSLAGKELQIGH